MSDPVLNTENPDTNAVVGEQPGGDPVYDPSNPDAWGVTENIFGTPYSPSELRPETRKAGSVLTSTTPAGDLYAGGTVRKAFEIAARTPNQPIWIGSEHSSKGLRSNPVGWRCDDWFTHMYIGGATGEGKTTTELNLLTQIAYAGHGFCFIDPSGDSIKDLIARLPEYRLEDVIYISPPTGEFDRITPLNLLEVEQFDGEPEERYEARVSRTIEQNVGIIGGTEEMYARMRGVLEATQRAMIDRDEPFTLLSLHKLLQNEALQREFTDYINDDAIEEYTETIAELDQEQDLEQLIRRTNQWILDKTARQYVKHTESSVNISKAVENNRIILVDSKSSEAGESVAKAIGTMVAQRVWAAVLARSARTRNPEDRRPYFLAIDELNDALTEHARIPHMLENARKYRLSLLLASQEPEQLPDDDPDWKSTVLSQCGKFITHSIGDGPSRRAIAEQFDGVEPDELAQIPQYESLVNVKRPNGTSVPCRVQNFAPYPPLRDVDAVDDVIRGSLARYGVSKNTGMEYGNTVIEQLVHGDGEIDTGQESITQNTFLEAVDAVELFTGHDTATEFVALDDVISEIQNRNENIEELSARQLENAAVELPDTVLQAESRSDGTYVSLTDEGRDKVRDTATGTAASSGGGKHQLLLQETRNFFTRLGCNVTVPEPVAYSDGDPPDAVVDLPVATPDEAGVELDVDIDLESANPAALSHDELTAIQNAREQYEAEFTDKLAAEHDVLPALSNASQMFIEVESTTPRTPAKTIKNLSKAVNNDKRCVFVVRDRDTVNKIAGILNNPPLVRSIDDAGNRVLYTDSNSKLRAGDDDADTGDGDALYALRESGERSKWKSVTPTGDAFTDDSDTTYELQTTSGETVLHASLAELREGRVGQGVVSAWGGYDSDADVWKVYSVTDGSVNTELYEDEDAFKRDWSKISTPFIPETVFDRQPTTDDWCVVVLPAVDAAFDAPVLVEYDTHGDVGGRSETITEIDVPGRGDASTIDEAEGGVSTTSTTTPSSSGRDVPDSQDMDGDTTGNSGSDGAASEDDFSVNPDGLDLPDEVVDPGSDEGGAERDSDADHDSDGAGDADASTPGDSGGSTASRAGESDTGDEFDSIDIPGSVVDDAGALTGESTPSPDSDAGDESTDAVPGDSDGAGENSADSEDSDTAGDNGSDGAGDTTGNSGGDGAGDGDASDESTDADHDSNTPGDGESDDDDEWLF